MLLRTGLCRVVGGLFMLLNLIAVESAPIETLLMPGQVISGHADIEAECGECHSRLGDKPQNALCLDCHEDVAEDLAAKEGYHGRRPGLADEQCKRCHTEHRGREADVVRLDTDRINHGDTDFPLEHAHRGPSCDSCHVNGKAYRDAPDACVECHRGDAPHRRHLGDQCADCHSERSWMETTFDHKETDFALRGAHEKASCSACHPDQRYENTPDDCYACHALDDVHRGLNGQECGDCHTEQRWDKATFDHAKDTTFPLDGRHARLGCDSCHEQAPAETELGTDCFACHRDDDRHHGRNGDRCTNCHDADSWTSARFDHDLKTDFPLRGKHDRLACTDCHRGRLDDELDTGCVTCHRADDAHSGEQGRDCGNCHQESGWGDDVQFDHDLTRFPLIGLHATAPCEECHLSTGFRDAPLTCNECHSTDDLHERTLGTNCGQCHNPNAWALWEFDHDLGTDFALEGGHRGLSCISCHQEPARDEQPAQSKTCNACHAQDDRHRGRFGAQCDRCHDQESFEQVRMQP